tara:strand:- start:2438 stop:4063 length:1626 start_codon:yes stop_codon:yes gene_type:complete
MCGIIGTTNKRLNRTSLNQISHRGPDERGLHSDSDICLGHTRLSILGLDCGTQPLSDDEIVLSYNGEIYNYIELANSLGISSSSDTEVLAKYYQAHGLEKTLRDINGMFSIAIYDRKKDIIYLVRDRMGIKPLFYSTHKNEISFCSEINPLRDLIGVEELTINKMAVALFFNLYYIPWPNTIWNEIKSVPPGSYIEYNLKTKKHKIVQYWNIEKRERNESDFEQLENLLCNSVKLRMRSDVPYGAYLSGGNDSTLVVKCMTEHKEENKTFTAVIQDEELNEKEYADLAAKKFKTKHTDIDVEYGDIKISFLRELIKYFGQPFADSSIVPTYLISKEIAKNVTVAIGGDGADEIFCGYNKYNNLTADIKSRFYRNVLNNFLNLEYNKDTYGYLKSLLPYETEDDYETLRLLDIKFFLEGDILQKVDRMSMASSLEVRVPFLDHRVVEFSNRLKREHIFGDVRKYAVKHVLSKYMSHDFVHRSKIGFMLNITEWIEPLQEYVNFSPVLKSGIFKEGFDIKKIDNNYLKFAILIFTLWYEENYA